MSDQALLGQFTALVKQDQRVTADLLRYLDAIDRRQLWATIRLFVPVRVLSKTLQHVRGRRKTHRCHENSAAFPVLLSMVARGEPHLRRDRRSKSNMRVLDSLVEMVELVHKLAGQVARQGRDLAQQMKRAITGAALNASEGVWARTGKRRSRLEDAVNSARETLLIPDSLSGGARRVANNSIFS